MALWLWLVLIGINLVLNKMKGCVLFPFFLMVLFLPFQGLQLDTLVVLLILLLNIL